MEGERHIRADGIVGLVQEAGRGVAELLWPTRCVGCDLPGELLCERCRASLPWIEQRWACPVCGAPFGWLVCTACDRDWEPRAVVSAFSFEQGGVAARLAAGFKDGHELRLAGINAAAMVTALEEASAWLARDGKPRYCPEELDAICFVPATAEAFRRRGFDHMELVAHEISRIVGLPVFDVLVRSSAHDQRDLGREERLQNLASTVRAQDNLNGVRMLLVDDVCTTGASLRECTRALLQRGCESVTCCTLARVW